MTGDGNLDQTSNSAKADGYYGYKDGYQTIVVYFNSFIGRIYVDASLELDPVEDDWFPVNLTALNAYKQYDTTTNGTEAFTVQGNFVQIRFRKIRSYISSPSSVGDISKVKFSV
jgi:hypothetical protein